MISIQRNMRRFEAKLILQINYLYNISKTALYKKLTGKSDLLLLFAVAAFILVGAFVSSLQLLQ